MAPRTAILPALAAADRQHMLTVGSVRRYASGVDVEPSARKHGVSDDDMLHAVRHHWRAFETDDPAVTMFVGPSRSGDPLEVGVVVDEDGVAVIHALAARAKFLRGWWTR